MPETTQLPKPWPRKPPKDALCDATIGSDYDRLGKPVVYTCRHAAEETLWSLGLAVATREIWLCTDHADDYVARGYAARNPRATAR